MNYIILTILALVIAQFSKFIFRYLSKTNDNKNFFWVFTYATGAPSAHATVLVSNLVLLSYDIGYSPVFYFCCIISTIFMYNLIADRKREVIRESNPRVMDISGHSPLDIITGVLLGLVIGFVFVKFCLQITI